MYSDLLDVLGGQGGGNGGGGGSGGRNGNNETHTAVSFKAGKMDMALQENGKYLVTANPIRGEIRMVYHKNLDSGSNNSSEGELKWEFFDRRAKSTVDSIKIEAPTTTASDASASTATATLRSTFERVETGKDTDRVYLWTTESDERRMFWMQEGTDENDDTHVAQVNQFLTNPQDANPNSNSTDAGAGSGTGGGSGGMVMAIRRGSLLSIRKPCCKSCRAVVVEPIRVQPRLARMVVVAVARRSMPSRTFLKI